MKKRLMIFAGAVLASAVPATPQASTDYVDVSAAKYSVACPTPFDNTGRNNDLCQVRAAVADLKANIGYHKLFFPAGITKVETADLAAAISTTKRISIIGLGQQRSSIFLGNSKGAFFQMASPTDCNSQPGYCNVEVSGLTITGNGVATTGDVFDVFDAPYLHFFDVIIRQANAFAINLVNDTERSYFDRMTIDTTLGLRTDGDGNETYFDGLEVLNSGLADGNFCYDGPECNPDHTIRQSGVVYANPHMAVKLDGVVNDWSHSSIKSTVMMGGIQLPSEGGAFHGGYIEGAVPGGLNAAVVAGDGKIELGHLTAALAPTDTVMSVDDARWQQPYVTDPALAKTMKVGAGRSLGCIYPADHDITSNVPSTAVPSVAKNYCEPITVAGFAGDGKGYLQGTRSGKAWPIGSVVEMNPHGIYGAARLEGVHVNSDTPYPWNATLQDGCSDTAQLTTWVSSASRLCAEIIVGPVPDGYAIAWLHQTYAHVEGVLHLTDDTFYTNTLPTSELDGAGWIKIPANGQVVIDQANSPMQGNPSQFSYQNSNTQVQFLSDPLGGTAGGIINDTSGRYLSIPSEKIFDAWTISGYNQPMQHWTLNSPAATASVITH